MREIGNITVARNWAEEGASWEGRPCVPTVVAGMTYLFYQHAYAYTQRVNFTEHSSLF